MSHYISVIITKHNPELKQHFPHIKTHNGFDIFPIPEDLNYTFALTQLTDSFVMAHTDYFGGCGEQEATFFSRHHNFLPTTYTNNTKGGAINSALQRLGVTLNESDFDEFEAISLHKYRSNHDFYHQ